MQLLQKLDIRRCGIMPMRQLSIKVTICNSTIASKPLNVKVQSTTRSLASHRAASYKGP